MPNEKAGVKAIKSDSAFRDDVYVYRDNELEQIRGSLGMYIGQGDKEGAMHLVNEILTNSIDECTNPSSPGNTIWFTFMEKECRFIIEDNGRGIPLDILPDVIQKKHFSTKFNREFNRYSGGQNGVGTTVTAALSDFFKMQCWREHASRSIHLQDNSLIDEGIQKEKSDKHGTYTEFVPSKKIIGKFDIDVFDVDDYLRRLSYIMPEKIKIKYLSVNKKGKEVAKTITHQGIVSNVSYLSQNLLFAPIYVTIPEQKIVTEDNETEYFKMEFAFSYDSSLDEMVTASFCDYLATKEGGTHEQVMTQSIASFFVRQSKLLDANAKYEVTTDDCRKGLIAVVNCDHSNPKFEGQHKSKVDQKNILTHGRTPIMEALQKYFETNNGLLRKIVAYLRTIAKIRLESHKIKSASIKKATSFLDDAEIRMFRNISDRNYSGYKELIISEGDSSIGALEAARNVKCQAIFGIRGVVTNTYGMKTSKVLESDVFRALTSVLGCGIGKDFDMNKLKFDAILICSDSDSDGINIASLLSTFFACHMPQIIQSGKLYRVVPPLYRLNEKKLKSYGIKRNYIFDKVEYYHLYHKIIANSLDISVVHPHTETQMIKGTGDVIQLNKNEKIAMLDGTVDYYDELQTLQKRSFCNPVVLEYVCYFLTMAKDREMFQQMISKKFPELTYVQEYESIIGSYNGENISLIVDRIFMQMARRFLNMIAENASIFYVLVKNGKDGNAPKQDDWELMTYGQFMEMCAKTFMIDIEQRYKGIGEGKADMTFPSMMNPKTRKLIRITMDDAEDAMKTICLLHGSSDEMRKARRKMLAEADITLQDIDN